LQEFTRDERNNMFSFITFIAIICVLSTLLKEAGGLSVPPSAAAAAVGISSMVRCNRCRVIEMRAVTVP
jgi:hypothetical protein